MDFVTEERTQAPWLETSGLFSRVFGSSIPWARQAESLQTSSLATQCHALRNEQMMFPFLKLTVRNGPICSWRGYAMLVPGSYCLLLPLFFEAQALCKFGEQLSGYWGGRGFAESRLR